MAQSSGNSEGCSPAVYSVLQLDGFADRDQ